MLCNIEMLHRQIGPIQKQGNEEKLLGVMIDKTLNFKSHVSSLC